ncbi:pirin family protein [Gryllotalpicola protaetiae]|uniref:Pirin family protein n=1 Tax=Gryllotalpicola protaetiae TaxID=2419771 RepID=A0A387BGC4_9MICO|nr:pirin family protein [Gryllotalpicola protaetiae]
MLAETRRLARVSNLELDPRETVDECRAAGESAAPMVVLEPREVPLGGPRAMTVHRTLPQRARSTIGAWCFVDHYGPDDVSLTGGMTVPPHPHIGLQTVSWLFRGEVRHRDSVGSDALVRPGELNLMTAGHGISHTEYSTPTTTVLHGVQLWLMLPDASRDVAPSFEHTEPVPFSLATDAGESVRAHVFVGSLVDFPEHAAVTDVHSPLLGAQLELPAGASLDLALDASFEHGILVDQGAIEVDGAALSERQLGYLEPGRERMRVYATAESRVLLLGGAPLNEPIVMWWNFVGRTHDDIVQARADWQAQAIEGSREASGRFGFVPESHGEGPLPAPVLPTVRLKPREQ